MRYIFILAIIGLGVPNAVYSQWINADVPSANGKIIKKCDSVMYFITNGTVCSHNVITGHNIYYRYNANVGNIASVVLYNNDTLLIINDNKYIYALSLISWNVRRLMTGLPSPSSVNTAKFEENPGKNGEIYLCYGRIYVLKDMQTCWVLADAVPEPFSEYSAIIFTEATRDTIIIAEGGRPATIRRSTNSGLSWSTLYQSPSVIVINTAVVHDEYYAVGPYESTDYGSTWHVIKTADTLPHFGSFNRQYVISHKYNDIYAVNSAAGIMCRYSGTRQYAFTRLSTTSHYFYPRYGVHAEWYTPDSLLLCQIGDSLYLYNIVDSSAHVLDVNTLRVRDAVSDLRGEEVFIATDYSIRSSADPNGTWKRRIDRLLNAYGAVRYTPARPNGEVSYIANILYQTVTILEHDVRTEKTTFSLPGCRLRYHPLDAGMCYGGDRSLWRIHDSDIVKSTEGQVFYPPNLSRELNLYVAGISFDPDVKERLYILGRAWAIGPTVLYRTDDDCRTWKQVPTNGVHGLPISFIVQIADTVRLSLLLTDNGLFVSSDNGITWQDRSLPHWLGRVTSIAVDTAVGAIYLSTVAERPESEKWMYLEKGGVYRTIDGGRSWTEINTDGVVSPNISYITWHNKSRKLLIGTECGVYTTGAVQTFASKPENGSFDSHLILYPNPCSNQLTLDLTWTKERTIAVRVVGVDGRIMETRTYANDAFTGTRVIDVTKYHSGVYSIIISSGMDHRVAVFTVIR